MVTTQLISNSHPNNLCTWALVIHTRGEHLCQLLRLCDGAEFCQILDVQVYSLRVFSTTFCSPEKKNPDYYITHRLLHTQNYFKNSDPFWCWVFLFFNLRSLQIQISLPQKNFVLLLNSDHLSTLLYWNREKKFFERENSIFYSIRF